MTHALANDQVAIRIREAGAELISLRADGVEYLWQADPAVWGRHAPVLFPAVGRLRHNQYTWQGKSYALGQHGFARDAAFTLSERAADRLTFTLRANDVTRAVYPFEFELTIRYVLTGDWLTVAYEVANHGTGPMPFSIGAHPGFACPLLPDESFEDYYLQFSQPETLDRHLIEGGLLSGHTEPLLRNVTDLPLTRDLFTQDAIVLRGHQSQTLSLRSRQHARGVEVELGGFPYLGIWTKDAHSPFVCIEPWYGVADRTDADGALLTKPAIISLTPGGRFACQHRIRALY